MLVRQSVRPVEPVATMLLLCFSPRVISLIPDWKAVRHRSFTTQM